MTNSIVQIPFHGTNINAVLHGGKPFVSLRHMCDSLGIDTESQRKKLNGKSWSTAVIITAVGADGKNRDMHMIDRRTMTMWLATIDTNRVKAESRELLEAFQNEAADALDRHFNGTTAPLTDDQIVAQALQITSAKVKELEAKIERDAGKVAYVDEHVNPADTDLFRTICRNLQINESDLRRALIYRRWIYIDGTVVDGAYVKKRYSAYQNRQRFFKHCKLNGHKRVNGTPWHTLKLTAEGVAAVTRLVRQLEDEYGSLRAALPDLETKYKTRRTKNQTKELF